jgi:hypothetical protein
MIRKRETIAQNQCSMSSALFRNETLRASMPRSLSALPSVFTLSQSVPRLENAHARQP